MRASEIVKPINFKILKCDVYNVSYDLRTK